MHQLIGLIPNQTVQELLNVIIDTLTQEEFDYWGEVKDEVMLLVGQYINEHNMNQIEVYQDDLVTLMDRYAGICSLNRNGLELFTIVFLLLLHLITTKLKFFYGITKLTQFFRQH